MARDDDCPWRGALGARQTPPGRLPACSARAAASLRHQLRHQLRHHLRRAAAAGGGSVPLLQGRARRPPGALPRPGGARALQRRRRCAAASCCVADVWLERPGCAGSGRLSRRDVLLGGRGSRGCAGGLPGLGLGLGPGCCCRLRRTGTSTSTNADTHTSTSTNTCTQALALFEALLDKSPKVGRLPRCPRLTCLLEAPELALEAAPCHEGPACAAAASGYAWQPGPPKGQQLGPPPRAA
jgi:hypothetical protein